MVELTKLNKQKFYINPSLVYFIDETPDTMITMSSGVKVLVSESASDVSEKFKNYNIDLHRN